MSLFTYFFADCEFDGPTPGINSMVSFGCVAHREDGKEIDKFERNLLPLDGAVTDARTMRWWSTQPDAWSYTQTNQVPAKSAMEDLVNWVRDLPGNVLFCAAPLMGDGIWLDWYLKKFTDYRITMPQSNRPLFVGDGLDIMSYVQAVLGLAHTPIMKDLPTYLLTGVNHNHFAIDDARGHAKVFFNARRARTKQLPAFVP
ncbi:MAG: hypothetical protein CMG46_06835 [Candidatus Marinimicrobia bacterium]|nr:hypothetical protein [Candidatus Neomarinimicrobiota bacterium]